MARQYLDEATREHAQTSDENSGNQELPVTHTPAARAPIMRLPLPRTAEERMSMERKLEKGYSKLRSRARIVLDETRAVNTASRAFADAQLEDLEALIEGRLSDVVSSQPPRAVRDLARQITANNRASLDLIIDDFAYLIRWLQSSSPTLSKDDIRERLVKRQLVLEAAFPEHLAEISSRAFMHIEHEILGRAYENDETMLGDSISDIPRSNFFVSEDNFAWDMEELVQAIRVNGGVMRNPLSRQLFGPDDVRKILKHPLAKGLERLYRSQGEYRRGVRTDTTQRLAEMGRIMLEDQTDDAGLSRNAIDEFLTYAATLTDAEQNTLKMLKIPAIDSYSGQAFDYTIDESISDAKGNRTCFHKVGDFLSQAARYLQRQ